MRTLMIGISGIRGIIGESLTPELLIRFASAFGTYLSGGKVVVGRDTRISGAMIKHSVFAGLMSTGCEVVDVDVATTPSVSLMVKELGARGAVVITGSHNPVEWNALKFMGSDGEILPERRARELLDIYYAGSFRNVSWNNLVPVVEDDSAGDVHINRVLRRIDVKKVRRRRIKVAIDSCNGAGSLVTPKLLKALGCEVVPIHCTPDGLFPHNPEPTFSNVRDLCRIVRRSGAEIGFAQDADADRLAVVNEKGTYLSEEYTLALAAMYVLEHRKGDVAANLSTSRMVDDIAARHGVRVFRTKVGEANVAEEMKAKGCVIGGEGNGGVIDPEIHYTRDSLVAIALVLSLLAERGETISRIAGRIPRYHMRKLKVEASRDAAAEVISLVGRRFPDARADRRDGLRLDWPDRWVHVRPSATEPALRIIAEAPREKDVEVLGEEVMRIAERVVRQTDA
ncbi:MAG: phosphoglucosamine mutase [Planctomycetota bacterium]